MVDSPHDSNSNGADRDAAQTLSTTADVVPLPRWRRGFVALPRGWLDHPVFRFRAPVYSRAEAFAWLVEHARYTPQDDLERGQLRASMRTLGDAWKWHPNKVLNFLRDLRLVQIIDFFGTHNKTEKTLITVCNYADFQRAPAARGTDNGTNNPKKRDRFLNQESNQYCSRTSCSNRARTRGDFQKFWEGYPNKVGKIPARHAYLDALDHASPQEILDGLQRYRSSKPADRQWLNPATFLREHRWLDETPADLAPRPNDDRPNGPPPPMTPEQIANLEYMRRHHIGD
jgi:hypothetical protein